MKRILAGASLILSGATLLPTTYLGVLTAFAVKASNRSRSNRPSSDGMHHIAVCVPAYNEQTVIADTVAALLSQAYPADLFDVHVVADNCSDKTAEHAVGAGATVHARSVPNQPGKGPALNWLFDRIASDYEVIVVIDADTIADPGFLAAVDSTFAQGADAAQGYYGVREPETSTTVGFRYAALACRHHLRPLARSALGCSSGLYGNGMAFRSGLLSSHRFSGHLIEDAEFQLELLLSGVPVVYMPNAQVSAEMPAALAESRSQHERWELGRIQLTRRFAPPLMKTLLRRGPVRRRVTADALADLLTPPVSALAAVQMFAALSSCAALTFSRSRAVRGAFVISFVSPLLLAAHVTTALRLVRAPAHVYRSLVHAPGLVIWKLALLLRVLRKPGMVAWTRTTRNAEAYVAETEANEV